MYRLYIVTLAKKLDISLLFNTNGIRIKEAYSYSHTFIYHVSDISIYIYVCE